MSTPGRASSNRSSRISQSAIALELHPNLWPIVYHPKYNVKFCLLEKTHPIYTQKWAHIMLLLADTGITVDTVHQPQMATDEELLTVHSEKYVKSLKNSFNVASISELCYMALVPNKFIQKYLLAPLRYIVHGSVLAGHLALTRGWAIHLGGGLTAASYDRGNGLCIFADVTLLIKNILTTKPEVKKIMIVDLDAHQGYGYAKDLGRDNRVFILDVFNAYLPPINLAIRQVINCKVELRPRVRDFEYLEKVETNFLTCMNKFSPDLVVYIAGTDILVGDPLGHLWISPEGVIKRDQLLFVVCRQRKVPIVMLAGGGYLRKSSIVISDSIKNLIRLGLISNN